MIMNNEIKKLSRNRKRRIERKNKFSDDMKLLLNIIKPEKKKKNKNLDKSKQLEILLVRINNADKPDKLQSALKELYKIQVIDKNLHEIKQEKLQDYIGTFEMVGNLKVGDQIRQTHVRFRNMDDFESYINSIDEGYDADDCIFNGYIYKINTPQFNKVKRSQYGNGCNFDKIIVEYQGNNCFIPTKGYCFVKCMNFLTRQVSKPQYLDFIRNEKRRSNIMTKARIQPFCRANNINLGYWDGERVFPRSVTNRDNALFLFNNHLCLIWKSEGVCFKQAIKELDDNFKMVDNYITEENVTSHFKYEFTPKKIESHLINFIVYDLETYSTDRARPYNMTFYRLSKIAGRYDRDPSPDELQKSINDTIAFSGDDCINSALDYLLKLKGEERKVNNKIVEYNLQMHAHNGSGFDTWIILNNLPCDRHIVGDIIKNGKGIIELKVFNGLIYKNNKQIPQYLHFRCGMTHLNYSLKKLGKTSEIPKELLKTEMNHDDIDANNYKDKKDIWLPYVKNDVLCTAYSYARYIKAMEEITGFSMKDCLSLPGLGWKYFNSLRTEEDEPIYTYNDKYMRWFVRQSIKGGRVCSFHQYYKSKHYCDIKIILSKELGITNGNIYDNIEEYLRYKRKYYDIYEKEYENQFNDYRDEDVDEKEKYMNEKLGNLRIPKLLKQLELVHFLWSFDATSFYPSAMWDEKSMYPRFETGYAHRKEMNDELVEKFTNQTFTQGSAILKIKYYNRPDLIFQHLPVKEKVKKVEVNRMRIGYIIGTLTSVDIHEIVKIGGKFIEIYEGVIYRENFKVSPFGKVIVILFKLRQKYKDEGKEVMHLLNKLLMNALYGEQIRKDIEEKFACKSEYWMQTEYDERVKDYSKVSNIIYIVKMIDDAGLEDEIKKINTMPLHLGSFVLSNSKRIMNNFIHVIDGFCTNDVYDTDTDSIYIENKHWDKLQKAGLIGKNLLQGKNDYKDGGIFYGLFRAP